MVFSQQMVVKREEMHASVYAWARSGVARRYWGVAGQITLSFRLFSPSPHNFRWWYRPRPGKCRQSHVRPLPHHIHYSTTSTPLPPTLQARTLEYQPLTQLLFYPQGCYIAAERRILATAYNGKSYTFTSLTTRNTLTSKYLNFDVSGISIPSATNLLPLSPGPKSKPIKATPY